MSPAATFHVIIPLDTRPTGQPTPIQSLNAPETNPTAGHSPRVPYPPAPACSPNSGPDGAQGVTSDDILTITVKPKKPLTAGGQQSCNSKSRKPSWYSEQSAPPSLDSCVARLISLSLRSLSSPDRPPPAYHSALFGSRATNHNQHRRTRPVLPTRSLLPGKQHAITRCPETAPPHHVHSR